MLAILCGLLRIGGCPSSSFVAVVAWLYSFADDAEADVLISFPWRRHQLEVLALGADKDPVPAAHNLEKAAGGALGVVRRRGSIIGRIEPVGGPLEYVAAHVVDTESVRMKGTNCLWDKRFQGRVFVLACQLVAIVSAGPVRHERMWVGGPRPADILPLGLGRKPVHPARLLLGRQIRQSRAERCGLIPRNVFHR